jgi:hypothetical protein
LHPKLQSISPIDLASTAAAAAAEITTVDPQALLQKKGAQPSLVAVRTRNNENWGESSMADTSPRTDTSSDPDIDMDERNQMVPYHSQLKSLSFCLIVMSHLIFNFSCPQVLEI